MLKIFNYLNRRYQIKKSPIHYARRIGVKIGENCRILSLKPNTFGSEPYLIQIGDHVTITSGVRFVTHDGGVWVFRGENPEIDVFGKIIIGNNVFIGINSIIMPGVEVGNNVVIGAGSVVTKSIPSNTVIGGVPARFICTLDDYEHKVMKKASFIKSKSKDTKKKILLEKLF